jgi:hypothetical protein
MRTAVFIVLSFAATNLYAQDSTSHVATKSTPIRTAPVVGASVTPAVGQLAKGATVQVIARDRDWVRVKLEGWVRESDLAITDSTLRPLSAADVRSDPEGSRGKLVQWQVEAVALQTADPLRTGLQPGEQYLLALGPAPEKMLLYLLFRNRLSLQHAVFRRLLRSPLRRVCETAGVNRPAFRFSTFKILLVDNGASRNARSR